MEDLLLEGDAFEYRREQEGGQPSWDLASVTGPSGALLFANELTYVPDERERVSKFSPRDGAFGFKLPAYLRMPMEIFRLDADDPHDVRFSTGQGLVTILDRVNVAGIYVVGLSDGLRARTRVRLAELLRVEESFRFAPAAQDSDFEAMQQLLR